MWVFPQCRQFERIRKIAKSSYCLRCLCLSLRLRGNNSAPTGQVFMKLDI